MPATPKATKLAVMGHFLAPTSTATTGNLQYKCKHCNSCISANIKATSSNLKRHMKRKHPSVSTELINRPSSSSSYTNPTQTPASSFTVTTKWKDTDPRQLRLTNCLINFIASDLIPFSIVDSAAFRELMATAEPSYTIPSRKHLSFTLLPRRSAAVQADLKLKMQQAQDMCLTIDIFSRRDMHSFIRITGHYILDYTIHSIMVACKRFKGSHTADNVHHVYQETIACYNLAHRVSTIVTDNAANMVKAFTLPGMEDLAQEEDEPEAESEEVTVTDEFDYLPPERSSCFAHTLQLAVKDGLKEAGQMRTVIAKIANFISHVRKSTTATQILESSMKLVLANATRWNSQLKMLCSLLRVPDSVLDQLHFPDKLTPYEKKIATELCDILQPFQDAIDSVQGEKVATSSMVIICVRVLRHRLQSLGHTYDWKLVAALHIAIEKRLAPYESLENFRLATTLDPRFKLDWCTEEEVLGVRDLLSSKASAISPPTPSSESSPPSPSAKRLRLIEFMSSRKLAPVSAHTPSTLHPEVQDYLTQATVADDSEPLTFWKENRHRYPTLAKLACKYLAIPASSAPVERLFNIAGKLFRPERCNLTDSKFEQLMMIRCNSKLN
ncbi:zinc finger BED domain-containing protein 4-like [Acipenser ruthenus]|uniref:zinc finger BED domain-containing protein 4-like n=1 Tax=Acipenser ruthenus TaxID=7906 RepID=UPI0027415A4E|nr:zinc finger BED domain-containing protein 4-like [Acipenser ruthenus]